MSLLPIAAAAAVALTAPSPAAPAAAGSGKATEGKWSKMALAGKDLYAVIKTSEGEIVVHLFSKDAPKTVANFVALATGEKEWTDPSTQQKTKKPLYPGTKFHRIIPDFMIQGGDPLGNGTGTPGYEFEDEFQSARTFDKPGLLAMANRGPNTNGSQFFITVAPTPWLNKRHTLFGEVISGYETVAKISKLPRGLHDKPNTDVVIQSIEVLEKAPQAMSNARKATDKKVEGKKKAGEPISPEK